MCVCTCVRACVRVCVCKVGNNACMLLYASFPLLYDMQNDQHGWVKCFNFIYKHWAIMAYSEKLPDIIALRKS